MLKAFLPRIRLFLATLMLLGACVTGAPAGARAWTASGLEVDRYREVVIVVKDLHPEAHDVGLTKDRLRSRIERRLRTAGLKPSNGKAAPHLYLVLEASHVKLRDGRIPGAYYKAVLQFRQPVSYVAHGKQFATVGATWQDGTFGIVPSPHGERAILDAVDELMDKFLNEYLNANQK